jgi:hypothetical protein
MISAVPAVIGREQASVGSPLRADRVEDAGGVVGSEAGRAGAPGCGQGAGGTLSGTQRFPLPRWLGRRLPHLVIESVAVGPVLPAPVPPAR